MQLTDHDIAAFLDWVAAGGRLQYAGVNGSPVGHFRGLEPATLEDFRRWAGEWLAGRGAGEPEAASLALGAMKKVVELGVWPRAS